MRSCWLYRTGGEVTRLEDSTRAHRSLEQMGCFVKMERLTITILLDPGWNSSITLLVDTSLERNWCSSAEDFY